MAAANDNVPEHIAKYKKLTKQVKRMLTTMERHHRGAYDAAYDKFVKDGDMESLEDKDVQEKFANHMADHYLAKAKQTFKVGDSKDAKLDPLEQELLINAYAGTTRAQLLQHLRENGKEFTFEHFYGKLKPKMMESIAQNLGHATQSHFTEKHIGDLVKYVKIGDFVDKDKMRLPEALQLLNIYEQQGAIPERGLKKEPFYKKKAA